nr:hypothetical protein [Tanacetum cinerariifolium]
VQEVVEVVNAAKLITEVVTATTTQVIPAAVEPVVIAVTILISSAKPKGLKAVPAAPTISTKKRKGVVIRDPEKELHDDTPAETQSAKDKGKGIFVEDPKPMKKKDQIAMDAEYARKLQEEEESLAQAKDAQATDVQPKDAPAKGIKEDLEDLWKIVKARFSTSKPTNWTDDYLLATLKNMFKKTDAQDVLWRSQQTEHGQALVKIEKKYPLSRFTLEQLVNVTRLQVEEESEMSLELLRFIRQQLLEYQQE